MMLGLIAKAASSIDEIIMHPVKFMGNLAAAVRQGLQRFVGNMPTHLATGLVNWLVTPLKDLGVEPIKDLSLTSILTLVMSVLGVTEAKLRAKVEKAVGPKATKVLEGAWKWIKALLSKGLGGIWEEIKGQLSNLYSMVIGGISKWITTEIVEAGVAKLIKLSNPAGAIIEAIQTIYKTLTFLVQKVNEILALVDSVLNSIQQMVAGDVGSAAAFIESSLARAVPTMIAFLAKWLGFSDPAPKVREIVVGIQAKVEGALDWLVEKAIAIGKKVMGALGLGEKPDERTPEQKEAAVKAAKAEAEQLLFSDTASLSSIQIALPTLKQKYRLTDIALEHDGDEYDIAVLINPGEKTRKKKFDPSTLKDNDVVLAAYQDPRWLDPDKRTWVPGIAKSVDQAADTFSWESSNQKVPRTAKFKISEYKAGSEGSGKWKPGHTSQQKIPEDQIIEWNQSEQWDDQGTATIVLNYRVRKTQFNPPGRQWEHIIEKSAGGAHSSENLALTASQINNRLGVLFGQPYASHEVPAGLSGTGGKPLRMYLQETNQGLSVQTQWKQFFYGQLGVSLKGNSSERGIWRELN